MKMNLNSRKLLSLGSAVISALTLGWSANADVFWGGYVSSDWGDPDNWASGFPTNSGAGSTIINPGANPCIVSTAGNYTVGQLYVSINGASLSIVSGGQLNVASDFVTGVWGASQPVTVTGQLTMGGYLNMGPGGYDGDVNIHSGGSVESVALSINSGGGARMDISTNGTFITHISQLGSVNYWVANNAITANGNAPGWAIVVDTNSLASKLKLTAVFTPPATGTNYVFDNGGGDNIWTNLPNWNPDGKPGPSDIATVAGGLYVILNSGTEGNVGKLFVGATNGEGAVNFDPGCNVSFRDTNVSLIVGGVTNNGTYPSYCIFNGGSAGTIGDLVLGGSGGRADARHYSGNVNVGGTLRLGSYLYSPPTSPTNASLRLIGNSGGFTTIGSGIEIGDAATLAYEFNGGSTIKALTSAGAVNISAGAVLVVDGTGYSGATTDLTLLQGSSLTGTFVTAILTNFPAGITPSLSYTATRLKLSLVASQPNFGLTITKLGGATNQITWNIGHILTATNITGPWQLEQCARSPLIEVAGSSRKFYRGVLFGTAYKFDNESGNNLWTTAANWNPDGTPGATDDTVVDSGRSVFVTAAVGAVGSVTVGSSTGNGALNINPSGSIEFSNPCVSVIIGGAYASPNNYVNYFRHGAGDLTTTGDFVMGTSGGKADAQFAGPGALAIGGTLRLGSYLSPGPSFFELLGSAGTITAGGLEVGGAGELIYNFNSDGAPKSFLVSGAVSLLSGSQITIRGNGFPYGSGTYDFTLIQGGSRTGTFSTVNVSGFPIGGTTATVGYSGGNVTLRVVVP